MLLTRGTLQQDPIDGTQKWLLHTRDGRAIETVLIPAGRETGRTIRATACVSSQIGCGVKCTFCATGRDGLQRNLTEFEILEQLLVARQQAYKLGWQLRNVVFMGMGEPLHNWSSVQAAIEFMLRDDGFYISPKHLCVSTAGVVPSLLKCAAAFPKIRLAISLHSCDAETRERLVPRGVGKLDAIRTAIKQLNSDFPGRTIWLEVIMLAGVTDREIDIKLLLKFCQGLNVQINLIPYNQTEDSSLTKTRSDADHIYQIALRLRAAGIFTTIRHSGGQNIAAACGQLATI